MSKKKITFEKPELSVAELSHALFDVNLKLQEANKELKQKEVAQKDFYANISHDLRAPITAIANSIEYLLSLENINKEDLSNTLTMMQKRTLYMEHLINDIFLLSSLDSSQNKIQKEPVDIAFFLEDYFYMCEADSKYSQVSLHLDIDTDLQLVMSLDPALMQRVLDNLFTNALKYTKSAPDITLGAHQINNKLIIYVADKGIGIAKKYFDKIFDRSYMIKKARTPQNNSSSGFGLAIVKSIIEHHDGTVHCESELGIGSRFVIELPITT